MLRITSGEFRNRRIEIPDTGRLRPMLEKPRMAIFSILGQDFVSDARVLDAFAGSGVLGLEALSRGAMHIDFYETQAAHLDALRALVGTLQCEDRCTLRRADVMRAIRPAVQSPPDVKPYRLLFLDPPHALSDQADGEFFQWFAELSRCACVDRQSVVVFGHAARADVPLQSGLWSRFDSRTYGNVAISFYEIG